MAEGGVKLLNCCICLEIYKKPKLLPCYHTFCEVCLEQYVSIHAHDKKFECPLCRKTIDVPSDGVSSYQTNFYIEPTIFNSGEEAVPCDVCGPEQPADHMCVECEENFCPACTKAHTTMKMTRDHQILELKSSTPNMKRKLKTRVFCSKHPSQELLVVCKKCDKLLCVLCTITGHKNHDTHEIAEEAELIKIKLASKVGSAHLTKDLESLQQDISNLEKFNIGLNKDLSNEILDLQEQCRKLHAAVDAEQRELGIQLKDKYQLRKKANTAKLQELKSIFHSRNAAKEMALAIIEKENEVGLVQKGNALLDQINKDLLQQPTIVRHKFERQRMFHPQNVDANVITSMIGTIDGNSTLNEASTIQTIPKLPTEIIIPLKLRPRQTKSFQLPNVTMQVYSIAPISNGRAWVYPIKFVPPCLLYQVDITGRVLQTLNVSKYIYSVATDEEEYCIVSCPYERCIMRVTTAGKEEVLLSGLAGKPTDGVIRSKTFSTSGMDELLFCTTTDLCSASYKMPSSPSKLSTGHKNHTRVNTDPMTGNICISDWDLGKVFILDKSGEKIGMYKDDVETFQPFGVCFDNQGCVLVTNEKQNQIRRLTSDGSLVEIMIENECKGCRAVAVDKYNRVWLGGKNGQIRVYEMV